MEARTFVLKILMTLLLNVITIGNFPVAVIDAMLLTPGLLIFTSFLFSAGYYWLIGVFIYD